MKFVRLLQIFAAASLAACSAMPGPGGGKADVAAASQAWVDAVNACQSNTILRLYHPEAVFWGTVSTTIMSTPAAIREYFERNCAAGMNVKIGFGEQLIRVYGDTALNSGIYSISLVLEGQPHVLPARYSFAYRQVNGVWLIVDHHSSMMPTPPGAPPRQ